VPEITLTWVSGYRRSYRGRNDAPFIRSIMHAPDQTYIQPQPLHCLFRSRHLHVVVDYCLDRNDFHRVSRAEGPSQLTWMSAKRTMARSVWWPNSDFVVYGILNPLFATEVSFRCLNRNVTEQKLNLLQFASGIMAQPSTGPA
jgi:hypothetical protein